MSLETYFMGWRLEHFRGWGGTSSPLFGSADVNLGISLLDAPDNPSIGRGCLWADFKDSMGIPILLNELWIGAFMNLGLTTTARAFTDTNNPVMLIHSSNPGHAIALVGSPARDGTYNNAGVWKIFLTTDYSNKTTYVDTGMWITRMGGASLQQGNSNAFYLHISGGGTTTGVIGVAGKSDIETAMKGSWGGDLSLFSDFHAISFHSGGPVRSGVYLDARPWALVVANENINYSEIQTSVATQAGTYKDWVGDATALPAYPVANASTSGLYSNAAGQTVSFTYSDAVTAIEGFTLGAVALSAAVNSDSDLTSAEIASAFYDSANSKLEVNPISQDVSADGNAPVWVYTKNPLTGQNWTVDLVNAYESGTRRTA